MPDIRTQVITGVISPDTAEARIRESWPSVASSTALATLGRKLTGTVILAPLAWLMMSAVYFGKVLPIVACRYTLTNKRVMIRKGWSGTPTSEVALSDIDDVKVVNDDNSDFFRCGNLEIISGGQTKMTLAGIPEPESFRQAILNARNAWVPGKAKTQPFIAASEK